ncbi:MAG TPA: hypothetical protein VFT66_08365 [Roseiflexaceae bacterium]|nr:hypothetical protein [Roseiflexaceae bacterium]
MPRLSQLMIRTALLWLAFGYTAGGLLLANKGVPLLASLWALRDLHIHVLLVGWTAQLACGVAFWILPRLDAQGSRGDERLVWGCFMLLNGGVVVAVLRSLIWMVSRNDLVWLNVIAGVLYLAATLAFARNAWPRIAPFRTLPRPSREQ